MINFASYVIYTQKLILQEDQKKLQPFKKSDSIIIETGQYLYDADSDILIQLVEEIKRKQTTRA